MVSIAGMLSFEPVNASRFLRNSNIPFQASPVSEIVSSAVSDVVSDLADSPAVNTALEQIQASGQQYLSDYLNDDQLEILTEFIEDGEFADDFLQYLEEELFTEEGEVNLRGALEELGQMLSDVFHVEDDGSDSSDESSDSDEDDCLANNNEGVLCEIKAAVGDVKDNVKEVIMDKIDEMKGDVLEKLVKEIEKKVGEVSQKN